MVAELRSGTGMGTLWSERFLLRLSFTALLLQVSLAPPPPPPSWMFQWFTSIPEARFSLILIRNAR